MKKFFSYLILILFLILSLITLNNYSQLVKYHLFIKNINLTINNLPKNLLILSASIYDALIISGSSLNAWVDQKKNIKTKYLDNIENVYLKVSNNSIKEMASNLPESAKNNYYPAKLLYPSGEWKKVEFRFRGRSIWHWDPNKPSLRIKLNKKFPINLNRHINLINPEDPTQIANYYASSSSSNFDILSKKYKFINLYINDINYGLYHYTSRDGESMLRRNNRMPGPIYEGNYLNNKWSENDFEKLPIFTQ